MMLTEDPAFNINKFHDGPHSDSQTISDKW